MSERKRGTMVIPVDRDKLTEKVREIIDAIYGDTVADELENYTPWNVALLKRELQPGMTEDSELGIALVCEEGVGWELELGCIKVPTTYGMMQNGPDVPVFHKLLREFATGEPVDLADYVRTFGSRLDTNVAIWQAWARGER